MSEALFKLVDLFKSALLKVKSIQDLKRLLKWAVGITMFVIWYCKYRVRRHDNIVTLPDWHPLLGHFMVITSNFEDIVPHTYNIAKRAGFPDCSAFTGFTPFYGIIILNPDIAKYVFDTKFESFKKGDRIQMELEELLGDGIFASDPPKWKFHRKS